jgi:hypothetical protein
MRSALSKKIPEKFGELLALNGYSGTVDFDHENQTLELVVQKDTDGAGTQTKDVKGLRYVVLLLFEADHNRVRRVRHLTVVPFLVEASEVIRPCACYLRLVSI